MLIEGFAQRSDRQASAMPRSASICGENASPRASLCWRKPNEPVRSRPAAPRVPGLRAQSRPDPDLDSGASAQKPCAPGHRRHRRFLPRRLRQCASRRLPAEPAFDTTASRRRAKKVRAFLSAADEARSVFVRGATEAINLVAWSWGDAFVQAGDDIIIGDMLSTGSNLVPWQQLCRRAGARLLVAPTDPTGEFDLARFEALLSPRTRLVAITPPSRMSLAPSCRSRASPSWHTRMEQKVLVDGCQAVPRLPVDVQALGVDLYLFGPPRPTGRPAPGFSGAGMTRWRRCRHGKPAAA